MRTLLIGNPGTTWREWLKSHRGTRALLSIDPSDPNQGIPGQLNLFVGGKPRLSRFYGSLDPMRAPHVMLAFLAQALNEVPDDLIIQLFPFRSAPLSRQVTSLVAQMVQPHEILVATGTEMDQSGFPIGPVEIEIENAFPPVVQLAQRKALWLKLFESCVDHSIDLRKVTIEGTRIGTGVRLTPEERKKSLLEHALYAERAGTTLFVVSDVDTDESSVAAALDFNGCTKAHFVAPGMYRNLLCSFARQNGEDFGMGILTEIDWHSFRAQALCTAVPPAPIRILRIGSLRVDSNGRELGELRTWQV